MVLLLAGCGGGAAGGGQAGRKALAVDAYGCPDIHGSFAFNVPGEGGVTFTGSPFEALPAANGATIPPEQIGGLEIRRMAPGAYRLRFFVGDDRVMQHLKVIREFEKPRYREWYHLQSDPARSTYILRHGRNAYDARLAELGPQAEIVRELRFGTALTCRDGWIEIPRAYRKPLRLTLAEDGSIIGEAPELDTVGVSVWCGDGCAEVPVPVGRHTGRLHWPRNGALRPWRPEDMRGRFVFERPIDEIEAEVRERQQAQATADARRYRTADAIRADLEKMAPPGTEIERVQVAEGKVSIQYSAPKDQMDVLLNSLSAADGGRSGPEKVERGVRSSDMSRRFVRFVLTDSPLVLREVQDRAPDGVVSGTMSALTPTSPVPTQVATLYVAPSETPVGMAPPDELRRRISALMPAGCRVTQVRGRGDRVIVHGEAERMACISDTLRAIASTQGNAGFGPELEQVEHGDKGYRFRLMLGRSALTKP
ncbi:hypothetical protein [Lysobacter brunescens]|uniref:Uncharacterized protein n=1 Tax=Lysobacter brunescens TaxID=262323 RepID=A0ABW2YK27_9GAMM